jgi:hypothetical protein
MVVVASSTQLTRGEQQVEYRMRDMAAAAYAVATGSNFPTIVREHGTVFFVFDDPDGAAKAAYEEYHLEDPFGATAMVCARHLFTAWRELRNALGPRPEVQR